MGKLLLFNLGIILVIILVLFICKKYVKNEKSKSRALLISSIVTILVHYSSFLYYCLIGDSLVVTYLKQNPNLILPIYPCNVVMWSALIYGVLKNRDSKISLLIGDYLFWFGLFSTLIGMFANVDFIMNPTLKDYEVTKSILAHATLLFNVLLIYVFGYIKVDFLKNMKHMLISICIMFIIGLYCNLVFMVLVSKESAYEVNSMFIIHSPFAGAPFLIYPVIAGIAIVLYGILFTVLDIVSKGVEERWFHKLRIFRRIKQ